MRGGDVATGSVIISAEVGRNAASLGLGEQEGKIELTAMLDDRLRCLDHHLEFKTAVSETGLFLQTLQQRDESRDLLGIRDLRKRHDEVVRQIDVVFLVLLRIIDYYRTCIVHSST